MGILDNMSPEQLAKLRELFPSSKGIQLPEDQTIVQTPATVSSDIVTSFANPTDVLSNGAMSSLAAVEKMPEETRPIVPQAPTQLPTEEDQIKVSQSSPLPPPSKKPLISPSIAKVVAPSSLPSPSPQQPQVIDFGANTLGSTANLQQLYKQLQDAQAYSGIAKGLATMGEGLSGIHGAKMASVDKGFAEAPIEGAKMSLAAFKDATENQKNDPNSSASQGMRNLFKQMGYEIKGSASYADLERIFPQIVKVEEGKENRALRLQVSQDKAADRALQREANRLKEQELSEYRKGRLHESEMKRLQPIFNRAVDQSRKLMQGAVQIESTLDQLHNPDPNMRIAASSNIINMLQTELLQLASRQRSTVAGMRDTSINTVKQSAAKLMGYIQSMPKSGLSPEYEQQIRAEAENFKREAALAYARQANSVKASTKDPEHHEWMDRTIEKDLTQQNFDPEEIQNAVQKGPKTAQSKVVSSAQLQKYAQEHGRSVEEAKNFLASQGYQIKD